MFDSLIDQKIPVQILKAILQKGRIPNCLLFTGIEGIGKEKAAVLFDLSAFANEPVFFFPWPEVAAPKISLAEYADRVKKSCPEITRTCYISSLRVLL